MIGLIGSLSWIQLVCFNVLSSLLQKIQPCFVLCICCHEYIPAKYITIVIRCFILNQVVYWEAGVWRERVVSQLKSNQAFIIAKTAFTSAAAAISPLHPTESNCEKMHPAQTLKHTCMHWFHFKCMHMALLLQGLCHFPLNGALLNGDSWMEGFLPCFFLQHIVFARFWVWQLANQCTHDCRQHFNSMTNHHILSHSQFAKKTDPRKSK